MSAPSFPFYNAQTFLLVQSRPRAPRSKFTQAPHIRDSPSNFAMASRRERVARGQTLPSDSSEIPAIPPYKLYNNPRQDLERRIIVARSPKSLRILQAISRTMDRQQGVLRGSVDDPASPPTLYEWIQAAVNGEAARWESTPQPARCLFCGQRFADMRTHLEGEHGAYWRRGVVQEIPMTSQDIIGTLFLVALLSERDGMPALSAEEEESFRSLLEIHNHVSFAYPGNPFPILFDRLRPLTGRALAWAMNVPPEDMWAFRQQQGF
ncbi:hypothetical protein DL93DRAFT_2073954 [Clavulina sp. PMI_390]|nr:hypothetical protein DL93DRAFT_2073954 [Clavulina sp. PMI_390]